MSPTWAETGRPDVARLVRVSLMASSRAVFTVGEEVHQAIVDAAAAVGVSVPDYVRRAIALTRAVDPYVEDGVLRVIDHRRGGVEVQVVIL